LAAAVLVAAALLTGCGDGARPASGTGAGGPGAGDQSTPGRAAEAYFEAVRDSRFGEACALLAPVVRQRYASAGQDCRTEMSSLFDEATRAAIGDVTVDEDLVRVSGDTAAVPGDALRRDDLSDGEPAPSFPDLRATLQDGAWYLLP
jgi:hypothetical protein